LYPLLVSGIAGQQALIDSDNALSYNPSTNTLTTNNLVLGTQSNKSTIQYIINQARTYSIPNAGQNAEFIMSRATGTTSTATATATGSSIITSGAGFPPAPAGSATSVHTFSTPVLLSSFSFELTNTFFNGTTVSSVIKSDGGGIISSQTYNNFEGTKTTSSINRFVKSIEVTITNNESVAGQATVDFFGFIQNNSTITYTGLNTYPSIGVFGDRVFANLFSTRDLLIDNNNVTTSSNTRFRYNSKEVSTIAFQDRRTSNATTTTGNTNGVQVFSTGSLVAGTYEFITVGTITRVGTTNRFYQLIFSFDSITSVGVFQAFGIFSPATTNTANTGIAMSSYNAVHMSVVTSNANSPTSGSYIQGTSNTIATTLMPFKVVGRFTLLNNRTFRVHIRQNATTDTTRVDSGASIVVYRVD
jgi:hypothetical protein